jgi:hypothetical protein
LAASVTKQVVLYGQTLIRTIQNIPQKGFHPLNPDLL